MNNITFARNLVKGRIVETIFAQMLRETGNFTVLELGYEKIIPELVQQKEYGDIVETLRTAPDFVVINKTTKVVQLIEVKYKKVLNFDYVLENAQRMSQSWNPSYLFIATLDGFYFDEISDVIRNNGQIFPLDDSQISKELQNEYLKILVDFER
ncbi:MAG: hypothetical protein NTV81_02500 [Candidatus Komeilibacteria bacterium]|nr:hypothetical protein [Candidatus Komeilibacteria bacterium]